MCGLPARLEVKAMLPPLGLHAGLVSMASEWVRRRKPPPLLSAVKISMLPSSERAKAMRLPSGEKLGEVLSEPEVTTGRLRPLARATKKIPGGPLTNEVEAAAAPSGA